MAAGERTLLTLAPREERGSRANRRLRREDLVPGVIYGAGSDSISFKVDSRRLRGVLAEGHPLFDVEIDGSVRGLDQIREPVRQFRGLECRALGVPFPSIGAPDLNKGMDTDHDRLTLDTGIVAQGRRQKDTPLAVELQIGRFRENQPPECPGIGICNGKGIDTLREGDPRLHGVERQARIDTTRQH